MEDWIDRYAEGLEVEPLSEEETTVLLGLARDVAHGSIRRFAPLATFLAGYRAGRAAAGPAPTGRRSEIEEAVAIALSRLEQATDGEDG